MNSQKIELVKDAIRNKKIVEFTFNPNLWGILTSISDDNTTIYFKRLGCGLLRYATIPEYIIIK